MAAPGWSQLIISHLHTAAHTVHLGEKPTRLSDMLFRTPLLLLPFVFWGPVQGGPMINPHPNITDQELFWGADQYDFSVVLRATGMECFWHFAHRGENFYLSFMVQWVTGIGHDRHLSVTVNAPSDLLVSTVNDAKGQINFEAEESGFYQMCFNNFHNRFGTMQIFISFGVYYDGFSCPTSATLTGGQRLKASSLSCLDTCSSSSSKDFSTETQAVRDAENKSFIYVQNHLISSSLSPRGRLYMRMGQTDNWKTSCLSHSCHRWYLCRRTDSVKPNT